MIKLKNILNEAPSASFDDIDSFKQHVHRWIFSWKMGKKNKIPNKISMLPTNYSGEPVLPRGYFLVKSNFVIGAGAWQMSFKKGSILRSTGKGGIETASPNSIEKAVQLKNPYKIFVLRSPPISGTTGFEFVYGYNDIQQQMLSSFNNGLTPIDPKAAEKYIMNIIDKSK